jgi:hypothetical protein
MKHLVPCIVCVPNNAENNTVDLTEVRRNTQQSHKGSLTKQKLNTTTLSFKLHIALQLLII